MCKPGLIGRRHRAKASVLIPMARHISRAATTRQKRNKTQEEDKKTQCQCCSCYSFPLGSMYQGVYDLDYSLQGKTWEGIYLEAPTSLLSSPLVRIELLLLGRVNLTHFCIVFPTILREAGVSALWDPELYRLGGCLLHRYLFTNPVSGAGQENRSGDTGTNRTKKAWIHLHWNRCRN